MDQGSLVENLIDNGAKLAAMLVEDGFDVTAAFWMRQDLDDPWKLYFVSKVFDEKGPHAAYQMIDTALRRLRMEDTSISMSYVNVISPGDRIAKEILAQHEGHRDRPLRVIYGMDLEGVYVYPHVSSDNPWHGINVLVTKDADTEGSYNVHFWPPELVAARSPGALVKRVPRPATVRVRNGKVVKYHAPERPLPYLSQHDYERKAIESVEQVAAEGA